jgi:hypothetical protein
MWRLIPWNGRRAPAEGDRPRGKPPSRRHRIRAPEVLEDRVAPAGTGPFVFNAPAAVRITLKYDGASELEIVDASGTVLAEQLLASTSNVVVNGFTSGASALTVNYGNPFAVPVTYNGASGGSSALSVAGGSFEQDTDQVAGPNSGTLTLINNANVSENITYSQVNSVTDRAAAADRIFDATPESGPEQIRLTIANDPGGEQTVDSNGSGGFASYTFSDPATQLIVNGGSGGTSFVIDGLDSGFTSSGPTLAINGGAGNDNLFVSSGVPQFSGTFNGMGGQNAVIYAGNVIFNSLSSTNVAATVTGQGVTIDGGLNNLFGLIEGDASFSLTVAPNVAATTSTGTNLGDGVLFTFSVTIGTGQELTVGSAGAGVTLTSGSLTMAILSAGSSSTYLGFSAQGVGGTINLPELTGVVSDDDVAINLGPQSGDTSGALNWSSLAGQDPFPVSFSTQPTTAVSGLVTNISLLGVLTASADFTFAIQPANVQLAPGTDLSGATLITVGLATLVDGSTAGGSSIAIAVIEPPAPTTGTDSRYWIAVDASGLSASLAFGNAVTATVSGVGIQVNQAGGNDNGTSATPLDWATSLALSGDTSFGDQVAAGGETIDFAGPTDYGVRELFARARHCRCLAGGGPNARERQTRDGTLRQCQCQRGLARG